MSTPPVTRYPAEPVVAALDRGVQSLRRAIDDAPDERWRVGELHHRNPVTPYAGRELTGVVRRTWLRGRENVHKRYLIHVAGHNLGLLMRLLIGAGTPKEAIARGWCFLILRPTSDGAAYAAILMVLVTHSAMPALIIFRMGFDRRPR